MYTQFFAYMVPVGKKNDINTGRKGSKKNNTELYFIHPNGTSIISGEDQSKSSKNVLILKYGLLLKTMSKNPEIILE